MEGAKKLKEANEDSIEGQVGLIEGQMRLKKIAIDSIEGQVDFKVVRPD
jgi:hypothetical protein